MKEAVQSQEAPQAIGPYSQAIRSGELLFLSGQLGIDPATGKLVAGGVREQVRQIGRNLAAVLKSGGSSPAGVIKTTVFLREMADFPAVNEEYARLFPAPYPARSTFAVAALPLGAAVEIEVVAAVNR